MQGKARLPDRGRGIERNARVGRRLVATSHDLFRQPESPADRTDQRHDEAPARLAAALLLSGAMLRIVAGKSRQSLPCRAEELKERARSRWASLGCRRHAARGGGFTGLAGLALARARGLAIGAAPLPPLPARRRAVCAGRRPAGCSARPARRPRPRGRPETRLLAASL